MRVLAYIAVAAFLLCCAVPAQADFKVEAERYLEGIAGELITVSKQKTQERRQFWVNLIGEKIDWREPARFVLKEQWEALTEEEKTALARWAKDEILSEDFLFRFLQNIIPSSCAVKDRQAYETTFIGRLSCKSHLEITEHMALPSDFSVKLEVQRTAPLGDLRITDAEYIGISFRKELGAAIYKRFEKQGAAFAIK